MYRLIISNGFVLFRVVSFLLGWLEKAEEDCFVVVYPIGNIDNERWLVNRCWNLPGFLTDETYGEVDGAAITTSPCCCYEKDDEETETPMGFSLPTKEPDDVSYLFV